MFALSTRGTDEQTNKQGLFFSCEEIKHLFLFFIFFPGNIHHSLKMHMELKELIKNLYSTACNPPLAGKKKKRHQYWITAWFSLISSDRSHSTSFFPPLCVWCSISLSLSLSCCLSLALSKPVQALHLQHSPPGQRGWVWYRMWSNLPRLILSILFFTRVLNTSIKPPLKVAFVARSAD